MTINQKMFGEIYGLLIEFPELHRQIGWEDKPVDSDSCGTTRCVAGWATWIAARDLGLLTRKRQHTDLDIRSALAVHLGLTDDNAEGWYYEDYPANTYGRIGGHVLGLDNDQAYRLFHDMNNKRVVARVKSYAETGEDISRAEFARFDEEEFE
jgi:hypothetical protein